MFLVSSNCKSYLILVREPSRPNHFTMFFQVMTTAGWILSTLLMIGSFNTMTYFTQLPVTYTSLEGAFYLGFHRLGWSLGLAWIIFACITGYGGNKSMLVCLHAHKIKKITVRSETYFISKNKISSGGDLRN